MTEKKFPSFKEILEKGKIMEDKKLTINLSTGKPYFSQRNNADKPLESCNVTACISALRCIEQPYVIPGTIQDEDYLASITDTPEMIKVRDSLGTWAKSYLPRLVFAVLVASVNKLAGKKVAIFKDKLTVKDLIWGLYNKKSYVLSTIFTSSGHIVTIVGFVTKQLNIRSISEIDENLIEGFIIDDPYGNPFTNYKDKSGNDIFVPLDVFKGKMKPYDNPSVKYGIEFTKL
jgi:hypothetical protein